MRLRFLGIACLLVPPAFAAAQTERLTIRMVPAPNQTLHGRTSMDMTMTMTPDLPAEGGRSMPPVATSMTTTAEHTTTVGPTDHEGHYSARVVCDRATHSAMVNGKPMPLPPEMAEQLVGQVMVFSYDDQGKMLAVAMENALDPSLAGSLKQMLTSALGVAPPITLSVGESVTVPMQVNFPLPAAVSGAISNTGETRYTLTSVTFDGADRIAHLAVASRNSIKQSPDPAASGPGITMEMRTDAEGTMDVNVDRGIVLHTETQTTIDGSTRGDGGSPARPPMRTHGTVKVSADLTK